MSESDQRSVVKKQIAVAIAMAATSPDNAGQRLIETWIDRPVRRRVLYRQVLQSAVLANRARHLIRTEPYGLTVAVRLEIAGTTNGTAGMVTVAAFDIAPQVCGTRLSQADTVNV
jgi:hypothetical protein